jgi:hypothetical protein
MAKHVIYGASWAKSAPPPDVIYGNHAIYDTPDGAAMSYSAAMRSAPVGLLEARISSE